MITLAGIFILLVGVGMLRWIYEESKGDPFVPTGSLVIFYGVGMILASFGIALIARNLP